MSKPLTDEEMEAAVTNDVGLTDDEMAEAAEFERNRSEVPIMPSSEDNTLIAGCPQCNAPLNAVFFIALHNITIESDGTIKSYEGGPNPESDSDVLDLANESNATIICEQGHVYAPTIINTATPTSQDGQE